MIKIGIKTIDKIHFDEDFLEELNKFAKTYRMKVTYYYGYIVVFDVVNVQAISPHKIVFSKYGYNFLVLYYDDYHETDKIFFVDGEKKPFTIGSMKKYVREYFSMTYKINCKQTYKK